MFEGETMSRREFTRAVKVEISKRACGNGMLPDYLCENCGKPTLGRWEIDHRDPDAMQIDKSRKLTAEDGWLLCIPCHAEKTKSDVAAIAKAKRIEANHLGVRRRPKQPLKSGGTLRGPERAHEGREPSADLPEIARRYAALRGKEER